MLGDVIVASDTQVSYPEENRSWVHAFCLKEVFIAASDMGCYAS